MSIIRVMCPHCRSSAHLENLQDDEGWKVINNIGCEHLFVEQENYGFTIMDFNLATNIVNEPSALAVILRENLNASNRLLNALKVECQHHELAVDAEIASLQTTHTQLVAGLEAFEILLKY